MFNKLRKGFTLVELLVVMGVLAVLAGALVVLLDPAERVKLATDTKAIADATQVTGAMQSYTAQNGGNYYNSTSWASLTNQLVSDGFLSVAPTPQTNYSFGYYSTGTTVAKVAVTLTSKKYKGAATSGCWCYSSALGTSSNYAGTCTATPNACP